jgi:hypothetical protein
MTTKITWPYISGLLESDGSLRCDIDSESGNLKPVIKISSKTNKNTLQDVKEFLDQEGINCTVEGKQPPKLNPSGRAPSLIVQGKLNCSNFSAKLIEFGVCMKHSGYKCSLLGNKQRNLMLLEEVCKSNALSKQEKLDLFKTFHKSNYDDNDTLSGTPRNVLEKTLKIEPNSSVKAAESLIREVDSKFQLHLAKVDSLNGKLTGAYVAGLYDGDGGFNITISVKKADKILEFTIDINLTLPAIDKLIFKAIQMTFEISDATLQKLGNCYQLKIRKAASVKKVISFFEDFPVLGDHKIQEIHLLKQLICLKEANALKKGQADIQAMKKLITDIYDLSCVMKGKERTPIDTLLEKVDEFYGN